MEYCDDADDNCHKLLESCTTGRPLQQTYMDEYCRRSCGFCYPEPSGCIDLPRDLQTQERWTDVNGMSCLEYKYLGWCAKLGDSNDGRGELLTDRDVSIYEKDGLSATAACCVCGGGRKAQCPNEYNPVCIGDIGVGLPSDCYANLTEFTTITDSVVEGGRCLLEDPFYEVIIGQSCQDSLYTTCRDVSDLKECQSVAEILRKDITNFMDVIAPPGCIMHALEDWAVVWNDATAYAPATTVFPRICACGNPCPCEWSDFPINLGSGCCPVWQVSLFFVALALVFIICLGLCYRMIFRSSKGKPKQDDGKSDLWGPLPVMKGEPGYPQYGKNMFFRRGYCCDCYTHTCFCFKNKQKTLPSISENQRVNLLVTDGKQQYYITVAWYYTAFGVLERICERSGSRRDPTSLELYDNRHRYLHPSTSVKRFGACSKVFVRNKPSCVCCFISCDHCFGSRGSYGPAWDIGNNQSETTLLAMTQVGQQTQEFARNRTMQNLRVGQTSQIGLMTVSRNLELPDEIGLLQQDFILMTTPTQSECLSNEIVAQDLIYMDMSPQADCVIHETVHTPQLDCGIHETNHVYIGTPTQ